MLQKLSIITAIALIGCSHPSDRTTETADYHAVVETPSIPVGFSVIEQQPDGYFIRLASAQRASSGTIRELADSLSGSFDRVDLCLDVAHERGDEYLAIIDGKVYDYENNRIYPLNSISK